MALVPTWYMLSKVGNTELLPSSTAKSLSLLTYLVLFYFHFVLYTGKFVDLNITSPLLQYCFVKC